MQVYYSVAAWTHSSSFALHQVSAITFVFTVICGLD